MTNTDPNNWFLGSGELPRDPAFTSENEVEALIDGEAFMSHLNSRLTAATAGDFFHLTGWRVTPGLSLDPFGAGVGFQDQILGLTGAGVTVRAMYWFRPHSSWVSALLAPIFQVLPGGASGLGSGSGGGSGGQAD